MATITAHDLEGIVAKRKSDPYRARVRWWKFKNPAYSQAKGRGELFNPPRGGKGQAPIPPASPLSRGKRDDNWQSWQKDEVRRHDSDLL